jgi:hypothetical protein
MYKIAVALTQTLFKSLAASGLPLTTFVSIYE